jgi:hypothetical protein
MLARQAPGQQGVYLAAARVPDPHSPAPGPAITYNADQAAGIPRQASPRALPDFSRLASLTAPVPDFRVLARFVPDSSKLPGTGVPRAT